MNPSTTGPGNVISDKADGTDGTYRFVVRATDPDSGGTISSVQIQIEDCDADANFETIGTATRVGTTDTYEYNWDIGGYTPASDVANCPAGLVRALVTDGNGETNFVGTATGQAVSFQDSTAPTAHITSPAQGGTLGFFPTNAGANKTGLIAGTASSDVTTVTGYYTTSPAGTDPTWTACGTDSSPATATGGTKTFSINCDITTATATNVTGVAVRPNTTGSGDAVRVTGYGQTLQSFTITPTSDNQTVGFCNTYAVAIVDQNGRAIAGAPVQVQVKGTNSGADTSSTDPDLQDDIRFAENLPAEGTSSDPFGPAGTADEPARQCDGAAEPDGAADDVDGTSALMETIVSGNAANDNVAATKAITGITAGNGQFKFSLALPATPTTSAGTYNINAFLDEDGDNVQDTGEVGNTATKTYQTATATTLTATPASATNVVGDTHTVKGTVTDQNGNPQAGQTLTFKVTSGPSATQDLDSNPSTPNGVFGQCTTGANGSCSRSYTNNTAGTDTIVVFIDGNGNLSPDTGEKQATASKTWVSTTTATCIDLEPDSATNPTTAAHEIRAYVTDGTYDASGDDNKTDAGAARENDCTGNPVANVPVDFTITGGPAAKLSPDTDSNTQTERVFTDANGVARITLTKDDATTNGINTVSANIPGGATASSYSAKAIPLAFEDISTTGTRPIEQGGGVNDYLDNNDDEVSAPITLPFPFTYYGVSDNSLEISTNGFLNFDQTNSDDGCCSGDSFPNSSSPNGGVVGGFWTDLDPGNGGEIYTQTLGTAPNRRFIVQYNAVQNYSGSSANQVTFEFKLFEGTNRIEVHYLNAESSSGSGADDVSAGVENQAGTIGTEYLAPTTDVTLSNSAVQYTPGQTSVSKRWEVAGDPTDLSCTPENARNVLGQQHTVTCTLTDFFGSPVAGKKVAFRVIYGPHADNDLDSNPTTTPGYFGNGTTNAQGVVSASYTGSDTLPNNGLDVIDAFLDANDNQIDDGDVTQTNDGNGNGIVDAGDQVDAGELSDFVNKGWSSSAQIQGANVELDMEPTNGAGNDTDTGTANTAKCDADLAGGFGGATWNSTTSGTVGQTEIVCVSVKDPNGNVLIGQNVTLQSTGVGQITDSKGQNGSANKTAAVGSDGYAVFYVNSTQSGTQNLTASAAGVTDTDTGSKTWNSLAARTITLENVGGSTATPGSTHQVKATVRDSNGNPVAGESVTFTESGPGRFLNGTSTEPSTITVQTGADGTVTVELTTQSTESGTETVTASLQRTAGVDECEKAAGNPAGAPVGVCSATVTINWTNSPPNNGTLRILSPASGATFPAGTRITITGDGCVDNPNDPQGADVKIFERLAGQSGYHQLLGGAACVNGSWSYRRVISRTTYFYATGTNGTTPSIQVNIGEQFRIFAPTSAQIFKPGTRVSIVGRGGVPGEIVKIYQKLAGQSGYTLLNGGALVNNDGTWLYRRVVSRTSYFYAAGEKGVTESRQVNVAS